MVTDANGTPMCVVFSGANRHDSVMLEPALDALKGIKRPGGKGGRPKRRFEKLHADKGYDYPRCREAIRKRSMIPRIARRNIEAKGKLGRRRYVVERTMSWLDGFRKIRIRDERKIEHFQALHSIACIHICFNQLQRLRTT